MRLVKAAVLFPVCLLLLALSACSIILEKSDSSKTYQGTELDGIAPDFRLTDQNEALVSLSDYHGKVIVLTFMDSQCKETCPLTAAQLRQAYRELGPDEASRVVFLGVNVNIEANSTADVAKATQEWHLTEIPSWHFLTGSVDELTPPWNSYNIAVAPQEQGEIMHTPGVFLIDGSGRKRWYISTLFDPADTSLDTPSLSELLKKYIQELLKKDNSGVEK